MRVRQRTRKVFRQRPTWLIERGYAKALETEGFNAATNKLEGIAGKTHITARRGGGFNGLGERHYKSFKLYYDG